MKYAPPNEAGEKPWVVAKTEWGRTTERIVYAHKRNEAEYEVKGRQLYVYAKGRRATPEDVERLGARVVALNGERSGA